MFGLKKYLYTGAVIAALVLSYVLYYQSTQLQITKLKAELQETSTALDVAVMSVARMAAQKLQQDKLNAQLQTKLSDSETYVLKLKTLLAEHDLTYLAQQKPGLIEKRINDATQKVFTDLEQLTGSQ